MSKAIKGRGGRPIKQADERRCIQINLRVTIAEHDYYAEQAERVALSVSEYLRRAGLDLKVTAPKSLADAALTRELNAVGNNVNQLARAANRGQDERDYWRAVGNRLCHVLDEVLKRTE